VIPGVSASPKYSPVATGHFVWAAPQTKLQPSKFKCETLEICVVFINPYSVLSAVRTQTKALITFKGIHHFLIIKIFAASMCFLYKNKKANPKEPAFTSFILKGTAVRCITFPSFQNLKYCQKEKEMSSTKKFFVEAPFTKC